MTVPERAGLGARLLGAIQRRAFGLPPRRTDHTVERGIRVPTRDGAELVTDHYAPIGASYGTVLIRTPYPRGFPESLLHGRMLAEHGYHVVIQSVRGTGGSTGAFEPIAQEAEDGQDAVAWLRGQPWFTGILATLGGSYLGWTQWALLRDAPPELRTAVVLVGPHDFGRAIRGTGSFALADFLGWSAAMAAQPQGLRAVAGARRRVAKALRDRTFPDVGAPWLADWLSHDDLDDPFWLPYNASVALRDTKIPVLLVGGWQDVFVDQTLEQYRVLREHNPDVALTVGPWTHMDTAFRAARVVDNEALAWLDQHLAGAASRRRSPVHIHVDSEWRWMPSWPPATTDRAFSLAPGRLTDEPSAGIVEFTYHPDDPTPAVGGRHMSSAAGRRDNRRLERRHDVAVFTSDPLDHDIEVLGAPTVRLGLESPATVFVRLCDVDDRGRSWNVTEAYCRGGRIELGPCAHRFRAGHRLRLQVSGGAYPRYAANPEQVRYVIDCVGSTLTLPTA